MKRLPPLAAAADESPAIYSDALAYAFPGGVPADEVVAWLRAFATRAAREARERGAFVGHIKLYAEADGGFACWIASTGGEASVKVQGATGAVRACRVAVTAIVFRTTAEIVRAEVLRLLDESRPDAGTTGGASPAPTAGRPR